MKFRPTMIGLFAALSLTAATAARVSAADAEPVDRLLDLNRQAVTAYKAGDYDKAKAALMDAVVLGKQSGLATHAMMARTYLHLGVVYTEGLKDAEKAGRYFGMAVRIRPDIDVSGELATDAVTKALADAREAAPATPAGEPERAPAKAVAKEPDPEPIKEAKKEATTATKEAKKEAKVEDAQAKAREKKLRADNDKLTQDLADLKERERKEREAKERLEKAQADKDRQIADLKERERKEREAKERLEKAQADKDRQIAAGKQQLAEKDKQLGEANQRERKEREAKERLDKDRQVAESREKERRAVEAQETAAREKLADGPDMPSRIPEEVFCPQLDDARAGADLFIHCAVQPGVKAKEVVFYYRPAGIAQYNALVLARSRKGWLTAMIPGSRLAGKTLQYYVEARAAAGEVAASIGKAGSPSIMTLAPPAGPPPTAAESRANDAALATVAPVAGRAQPARARPPAKRSKARRK